MGLVFAVQLNVSLNTNREVESESAGKSFKQAETIKSRNDTDVKERIAPGVGKKSGEEKRRGKRRAQPLISGDRVRWSVPPLN